MELDFTPGITVAAPSAAEIASRTRLPFTARSLSPRAHVLASWSVQSRVFAGLGLFLLLGSILLRHAPMHADMLMIGGTFCVARSLWLWWGTPADSDYFDPGIEIEVGRDGVTFRSLYGCETFDWIAARGLADSTLHRGPWFRGLDIDGPFGRLVLDDRHFEGGTAAAAVFVERCLLAAHPPRRREAGMAIGEAAF